MDHETLPNGAAVLLRRRGNREGWYVVLAMTETDFVTWVVEDHMGVAAPMCFAGEYHRKGVEGLNNAIASYKVRG